MHDTRLNRRNKRCFPYWRSLVTSLPNKVERLLIWDAYKPHISKEMKAYIKQLRIDVIVVPGGCTKFLQTLDVSCNKPFKESIGESYDNWMLNGEKTFTKSGNIQAASKTELCGWVLKAWKNIVWIWSRRASLPVAKSRMPS